MWSGRLEGQEEQKRIGREEEEEIKRREKKYATRENENCKEKKKIKEY